MSIDIIIIGAGPAGMSAAITAAESGAKVLLLDDQPTPGGQITEQLKLLVISRQRSWALNIWRVSHWPKICMAQILNM